MAWAKIAACTTASEKNNNSFLFTANSCFSFRVEIKLNISTGTEATRVESGQVGERDAQILVA